MSKWFDRFARAFTHWTGSSLAFACAFLVIIVWLISGPIFGFSDTWQLVINTATTIVTFLMVFVIQQAQNREMLAVHIKLNEIIAAMRGASNRMLNVEELTEAEVNALHDRYCKLAVQATTEGDAGRRHTIEEFLKEAERVVQKKQSPA